MGDPWGAVPGWLVRAGEGDARMALDAGVRAEFAPGRMPWWVRLWCSVPLVDRYAYVWMWHHGGWDVLPPGVDPVVAAGTAQD